MRGLPIAILLLALLFTGAEPLDSDPFSPGAKLWEPPKASFDPITEMIQARERHEVGYYFWAVKGERRNTIERLLKALNDETLDRSSEGPIVHAVSLLGSLRAQEAAGPLSEMIRYQPKGWLRDDHQALTFRYYPAAAALGEIGMPAVPYMLMIIADKQSTPLERKLAAWVLLQVEMNLTHEFKTPGTPDEHMKAAVISRLSYWMQRAEGVARQNYEDAVEFVKAYEETNEHPDQSPGFRERARFHLVEENRRARDVEDGNVPVRDKEWRRCEGNDRR